MEKYFGKMNIDDLDKNSKIHMYILIGRLNIGNWEFN